MNCLKYVRPGKGFVPNFPLSKKLHVNGKDENPLFTFLKKDCPAPAGLVAKDKDAILWSPVRSNDVRWNFQKFLIGHTGRPEKRYSADTEPEEIVKDIEEMVSRCVADDVTKMPKEQTYIRQHTKTSWTKLQEILTTK